MNWSLIFLEIINVNFQSLNVSIYLQNCSHEIFLTYQQCSSDNDDTHVSELFKKPVWFLGYEDNHVSILMDLYYE